MKKQTILIIGMLLSACTTSGGDSRARAIAVTDSWIGGDLNDLTQAWKLSDPPSRLTSAGGRDQYATQFYTPGETRSGCYQIPTPGSVGPVVCDEQYIPESTDCDVQFFTAESTTQIVDITFSGDRCYSTIASLPPGRNERGDQLVRRQ